MKITSKDLFDTVRKQHTTTLSAAFKSGDPEQMAQAMTGSAAAEANRKANLIKYGAIVLSSAPIMCMYPFVQKYFNQGVMIGALKG